ncbi:MAG TPA: Rieske (2Fe-2S) protein [Bacteroidales bacterium]|jgi:cytochrome b6-f complex iron-sulfur subunit|nr:Rieske (2Fe-2S) protein [Bacteroidales bacterium]
MTRRDLIQKVLIGGTTFLVIPSVMASCSKDNSGDPGTGGNGNGNKLTLDLTDAKYAALNNSGGFVNVQGIIVANTTAGYVALDNTCTHQGCGIAYSAASNNFPCPCHGSVFSTTGSVINGPATVALKSYSVSKSGNTLTITL